MVSGLLFLFLPEIQCQRPFQCVEDLVDAFDYLINRLAIAWLLLCVRYINKPFVTITDDKRQAVTDAEQLLAGLHESVTSCVGLFGLFAFSSVISTSIWYVCYVFVHWTAPSTTHHSTLDTVHLILLTSMLQFIDNRPPAQLVHYLIIKVVCFQSAWRVVKTSEPVLLERVTRSSPLRQMLVLIIFLVIAMEQRIVLYAIENTIKPGAMLTQWLTFPASLLKGLVAAIVTEYGIRNIAKRLTWLTGFAEDDVYLHALVEKYKCIAHNVFRLTYF